MTAPAASNNILKGSELAARLRDELRIKLSALGLKLSLATVQIGESPDVQLYSNALVKMAASLGVELLQIKVSSSEPKKNVIARLGELFHKDSIEGVMIFSPIMHEHKKEISQWAFLNMPADKDVEGRTFLKPNFLYQDICIYSPTARAVMALLDSANFGSHSGKEAVIVGHSDLVGKPTAVLLLDRMATVTVCHKETRDLAKHVRSAEILVAAAGQPGLIRGEWVKPGAIIVDVGENVVNGSLVGDVDFEGARKKAAFVTPVPGGVGPLTNVMLLDNLFELHRLKELRKSSVNGTA